jgi:hypothetical protein
VAFFHCRPIILRRRKLDIQADSRRWRAAWCRAPRARQSACKALVVLLITANPANYIARSIRARMLGLHQALVNPRYEISSARVVVTTVTSVYRTPSSARRDGSLGHYGGPKRGWPRFNVLRRPGWFRRSRFGQSFPLTSLFLTASGHGFFTQYSIGPCSLIGPTLRWWSLWEQSPAVHAT